MGFGRSVSILRDFIGTVPMAGSQAGALYKRGKRTQYMGLSDCQLEDDGWSEGRNRKYHV